MSYRLSRLLPPFDVVAAAAPELEDDLRGGAEDDLEDDVGGVAAEVGRKGELNTFRWVECDVFIPDTKILIA